MTPATRLATLRRYERSIRGIVRDLVAAPYRSTGIEVARIGVLFALAKHGALLTRRDALAGARAGVEQWLAKGVVSIRTEMTT